MKENPDQDNYPLFKLGKLPIFAPPVKTGTLPEEAR